MNLNWAGLQKLNANPITRILYVILGLLFIILPLMPLYYWECNIPADVVEIECDSGEFESQIVKYDLGACVMGECTKKGSAESSAAVWLLILSSLPLFALAIHAHYWHYWIASSGASAAINGYI